MLLKILFFVLLYFIIKNLLRGYMFFQKIQKEHGNNFQHQRNKHDNNSDISNTDIIDAEYKVVD